MPWPWGDGPKRKAPSRLDAWLPGGAWRLEHHAVEVDAPPDAALAALEGLRFADLPLVGALLWIRRLPFRSETTLRDFFSTAPFVALETAPGSERVFGAVGEFWRWRGAELPSALPRTPAEVREALASGRIGAVGNFRADPVREGCRLWTETWVVAPPGRLTLQFTCYWLVVGPFSAWIRRNMLWAAARKAAARPARFGIGP